MSLFEIYLDLPKNTGRPSHIPPLSGPAIGQPLLVHRSFL